VLQLIQLFSAQPDLKFPDLNASVLHDAVARVKDRHLELVRAEALLRAAQAALDEDQEALLKKAQRAHAYLRVFAETDDALSARVDAISLPRVRRAPRPDANAALVAPVTGLVDGLAPAPRKRGRPRKVQPDGASLFSTAEPAADAELAAAN
jgi:hypothetical protein